MLQNLVHLMPQLSVRQVTVDFEKAIWSAIREVLPTVKIQGRLSLDTGRLEEGVYCVFFFSWQITSSKQLNLTTTLNFQALH